MPLSLSASMTRWKPSVSSCSVPGASDLTAVFSMGVVSLIVGSDELIVSREVASLSKKFLAVRFDISRQTQRVVARTLFGELGVTRFQRLDDGEVLGEGHRGTIGPPYGELAIAAHVQEDVVGHVDQRRRFRQRDQRLVEGDIGARIFLDMMLRQAVLQIEVLEIVAERRDVAL